MSPGEEFVLLGIPDVNGSIRGKALRPPMSSGISYSLAEIGRYERFADGLANALDVLGVELAAIHTEAGPGLLEVNIGVGRGLDSGDHACLVKFAVKQVAASMDMRASFLAKTAPGEEGSSGHVHLSCWSGDANAFSAPEPNDPV